MMMDPGPESTWPILAMVALPLVVLLGIAGAALGVF